MEINYVSPKNIDELCEALRNKDEETYIIAGGTDLIIKFIKNSIYDYKIIDISKFEDFKKIEIDDEKIIIGSSVTMTEIENNDEIKKEVPALISAAANLGSTQIRNRATIGGNIANAAQCGDTIPVLFAYDASVKILNSCNEYRYEKIRDLILGIGKTTLKDDEVITSIIINKSSDVSEFAKVGSRKTVTISKVNCCGKFSIDESNKINNAEIYMGAVGVKPIEADIIQAHIIGKSLSGMTEELKEAIRQQIEKAIPNRDSKHYKKEAAIGLFEDMLNKLGR